MHPKMETGKQLFDSSRNADMMALLRLEQIDFRESTQGPPDRCDMHSTQDSEQASSSPQNYLLEVLPRELRDRIYIYTLRPDCHIPDPHTCDKHHVHLTNFLRTTKLLCLCRQIYHEAIELLHHGEVETAITFQSTPLFRHPKAFGQPLLFNSEVRSTRCFIPPSISELEFLRLRKISLVINIPYEGCITKWKSSTFPTCNILARLRRHIRDTVAALRKCTHVETLKLVLRRLEDFSGWSFNQPTTYPAMQQLLRPLIGVAVIQGFKVAVKKELGFDAWDYLNDEIDDPLVGCIREIAQAAGVLAELPSETRSVNDWPTPPLHVPRGTIRPTVLETDLTNLQGNATKPYHLTPECRTCYQLFSSTFGLHNHLKAKPGHRRSFQKKRYNVLTTNVQMYGKRKCWTCAAEYSSLCYLKKHLEEMGHERHGIVPRWAEDNEEWDKYWKGHKERHGWL